MCVINRSNREIANKSHSGVTEQSKELQSVHFISAAPSKNAVSVFQISFKLLCFTLEDS